MIGWRRIKIKNKKYMELKLKGKFEIKVKEKSAGVCLMYNIIGYNGNILKIQFNNQLETINFESIILEMCKVFNTLYHIDISMSLSLY